MLGFKPVKGLVNALGAVVKAPSSVLASATVGVALVSERQWPCCVTPPVPRSSTLPGILNEEVVISLAFKPVLTVPSLRDSVAKFTLFP